MTGLSRPHAAIIFERFGKSGRAERIPINDVEAANTTFRQCDANRVADPTAANQRDRLTRNIADFAADSALEAAAVRVKANQPLILHRDRVHRANFRGGRIKVVEKRHNRDLIRVSHDTGKSR